MNKAYSCSDSQTSSKGYTPQNHFRDSERNFRSETAAADTAAHAHRRTAQIAALLSTEAGQASVRRHLGQATDGPRASVKRQTDQLAAMLSTEAGKMALQKQLSDYLWRKHQTQESVAKSQSPVTEFTSLRAAAPTCVTTVGGSHVDGAALVAETITDTTHAADLHRRIPSAAPALAHWQMSSAGHALAELKQYAPSHITPTSPGTDSTEEALPAAAAINKTVAPQEQQLQLSGNINKALLAWLATQTAVAGENVPAAAAVGSFTGQISPTSRSLAASAADAVLPVAQIWAVLQQNQQNQQQHQQQKIVDEQDLMQVDGLLEMQQESPDPANLEQHGTITRVSGQVVFKRRSTNSTVLRRHFSNTNRTAARVAPAKSADSNTSGVSKPHQVFKKQRKEPLMLWSSSSTLPQQVQAAKLQHQQQTSNQLNTAEAEYSCATGGSGAATSGCDASASLLGSPAAADAPVAAAARASSRVEHVLSTLARQEQQLMVLQQQLKQQRQLITARRQAQAQSQQQQVAAAAAPLFAGAVQQLLLRGLRPGSMQLAGADVEMAQASQPRANAVPCAHDAVNSLMKLMTAQQQQRVGAVAAVKKAAPVSRASQGPAWDADVLRKLTAALLAA